MQPTLLKIVVALHVFSDLVVQISWHAQHFVNDKVQILWTQYFVDLEVWILWQAQCFVDLEVQIIWGQAQHFVNLEMHVLAGAALCEPCCADFAA